ncbi:MAG: hydroxyethylthiazole kinase [Coxiellaceae bacterium]|nr:hydroxyethylthiazole kinase [Coxiellaceae bacterium]
MILQDQAPLVLNITNFVTMQTCANMLLAIGASPLMAHAPEELEDIISICNSVVLNIGTLDQQWLNSMQQAQRLALQHNKPIVFDPVGAGASQLRTQSAKQLLRTGVDIVRGNASEILSLNDSSFQTKGVDSQHNSDCAIQAAQHISRQYNCCVVISGEIDYICSQNAVRSVTGGNKILTHVTGMGCAATAVIGAFAATTNDPAQASLQAMTLIKIAAEIAVKQSNGPGSFYPALLDSIYSITQSEITNRINTNDNKDQLATSA